MSLPTTTGVGVAAARIVNATKTYGSGDTEVHALNDVTAAFERGMFTAIMGPSGSGKSTLLHCTAGLDSLTAGDVYIGDVELGTLSDKQLTLLRRKSVGFVFQAYNLVPTLTARENVLLPLLIAGDDPDQAWFDQVVGILGLGDRLSHKPSELSGGQQQRVAAAGPWCHGPRSCSPTSPAATSTRKRQQSCSTSCAGPSRSSGRRS